MYSKLTVQFYYLRSLWTRCCSWCNGRSTVLSTVRWKDIAHVHFTDRLILAACVVASKNLSWISTANFQECTAFLDRFRANPVGGIFSKRLQFPLFIGSVRIAIAVFKKNWIELNTEAAKKYRNHSCLYISLVAVTSSLLSSVWLLLRWEKRCCLCCGVCMLLCVVLGILFVARSEFQFGVLLLL